MTAGGAEAAGAGTATGAAAQAMCAWLEASGCVCGKVRPRWMGADRGWGGATSGGGAGVARGEVLLAFPAGLLLDAAAAHRSALGPLLAKAAAASGAAASGAAAAEPPCKARRTAGPKVPDAWAIILLLLHERAKGEHSFWFPYIDMLPKHFDNALHFTSSEAAVLAGTHLADALLVDANRDLAQLAETLEFMRGCDPGALPEGACTAQALRWAHSVFWSRALVVPLDSDAQPKEQNQALCPYLDLLNHDPRSQHRLSTCESPAPAQTVPEPPRAPGALASSSTRMVALVAGADVAAGSEVVINYGRKSNEQLLLCVTESPCSPLHLAHQTHSLRPSPSQLCCRDDLLSAFRAHSNTLSRT